MIAVQRITDEDKLVYRTRDNRWSDNRNEAKAYGENALNDLGEAQDNWEEYLIGNARERIVQMEKYAEQATAQPEQREDCKEAIARAEGYIIGICTAIGYRRILRSGR